MAENPHSGQTTTISMKRPRMVPVDFKIPRIPPWRQLQSQNETQTMTNSVDIAKDMGTHPSIASSDGERQQNCNEKKAPPALTRQNATTVMPQEWEGTTAKSVELSDSRQMEIWRLEPRTTLPLRENELMDEELPRIGPTPTLETINHIKQWWQKFEANNKDDNTGHLTIPTKTIGAKELINDTTNKLTRMTTRQDALIQRQLASKRTPKGLRERNIPFRINTRGQSKTDWSAWAEEINRKREEETTSRRKGRGGKTTYSTTRGTNISSEASQSQQGPCVGGRMKQRLAGDASTTRATERSYTAGGVTSKRKLSKKPRQGTTKHQKTSQPSSIASTVEDRPTQPTANAHYAGGPSPETSSTSKSTNWYAASLNKQQLEHTPYTHSGYQTSLNPKESERFASLNHTDPHLKLKSKWMARGSLESINLEEKDDDLHNGYASESGEQGLTQAGNSWTESQARCRPADTSQWHTHQQHAHQQHAQLREEDLTQSEAHTIGSADNQGRKGEKAEQETTGTRNAEVTIRIPTEEDGGIVGPVEIRATLKIKEEMYRPLMKLLSNYKQTGN